MRENDFTQEDIDDLVETSVNKLLDSGVYESRPDAIYERMDGSVLVTLTNMDNGPYRSCYLFDEDFRLLDIIDLKEGEYPGAPVWTHAGGLQRQDPANHAPQPSSNTLDLDGQ